MIDRVKQAIQAREAAAIELLRALVLENSFTHNRPGCVSVGEKLARELRSIEGITDVRSAPSERFAPHWIASTEAASRSSEGAIALVGHLDTVFPPGTFEGFRQDETFTYGPGVLDMKGGLVVVLEALRAVASVGALRALPVRVVVVSDEEIGSTEGAAVIAREVAGASAALVFEAGRAGDLVITARKGTGAVRAVAEGRAAHAGNAHADGANAIWALARFVDRAQRVTDLERGVTVNVGTIAGGTSKNTVPERAEAELDFRFVKRPDGDAVYAELERAAAEAAAEVRGTRITLSGGCARPPLERTTENVALFAEYAACARAAGLGDGEAPLVGGGSDAATTAALGIPSIDGLGPRGTGFHTKNERIETKTLSLKAEALARFLLARGAREKSVTEI